MSFNDFSISESRDVGSFEYVFPLKRNTSTTVHETIHVQDNVPLSASSFGARDLGDEPRRGKRSRVETSFGPDFLTSF